MRKPRSETPPTEPSPPVSKHSFNLLAKENRGLLLDIVVFVANIFLLRLLSTYVIGLFNEADSDDHGAKLILTLGAIGMWVLPATGAILKRWHFHERLRFQHKKLAMENVAFGCLFNPIFYFCLNLVVMAAVVTGVGLALVGQKGMDNGAIFVPSIFLGLGLTIVQTYLIYRYFSPPKKPPSSAFLLSPESEFLGDACFFLNMLLYQCAWNLLTISFPRVSGVGEFFGRLFVLCFLALLIYFPPRMFYLAEDINRGRTWLMMLLANSPVIFRVLIGTNQQSGW